MPALKEVIIVGIDSNGVFTPELGMAKRSGIYEEAQGGLIIGDGKRELTREEIKSKLEGKIDKDTHIYILGHGDRDEGTHRIRLIKPTWSEWWGELKSTLHRWADPRKTTQTVEVIKILDDLSPDPLDISLSSCYSGEAAKEILVAKEGSRMRTYSEADDVGFSNSHVILYRVSLRKAGKTASGAQSFLESIPKTSWTCGYHENRGPDGLYTYTYRPFRGRPLKGEAEIRKFLEWEVQRFMSDRFKVDRWEVLSAPPAITSRESGIIASSFFLRLCESRNKPKYLMPFLRDPLNKEFIEGHMHSSSVAKQLTPEIIKETKINIDVKDGLSETLLMQACKKNDLEEVKRLLALGANPNERNYKKETPLTLTTDTSIAKELLKAGADPTAVSMMGKPASTLANPDIQKVIKETRLPPAPKQKLEIGVKAIGEPEAKQAAIEPPQQAKKTTAQQQPEAEPTAEAEPAAGATTPSRHGAKAQPVIELPDIIGANLTLASQVAVDLAKYFEVGKSATEKQAAKLGRKEFPKTEELPLTKEEQKSVLDEVNSVVKNFVSLRDQYVFFYEGIRDELNTMPFSKSKRHDDLYEELYPARDAKDDVMAVWKNLRTFKDEIGSRQSSLTSADKEFIEGQLKEFEKIIAPLRRTKPTKSEKEKKRVRLEDGLEKAKEEAKYGQTWRGSAYQKSWRMAGYKFATKEDVEAKEKELKEFEKIIAPIRTEFTKAKKVDKKQSLPNKPLLPGQRVRQEKKGTMSRGGGM